MAHVRIGRLAGNRRVAHRAERNRSISFAAEVSL
jgi:hypothetical protein